MGLFKVGDRVWSYYGWGKVVRVDIDNGQRIEVKFSERPFQHDLFDSDGSMAYAESPRRVLFFDEMVPTLKMLVKPLAKNTIVWARTTRRLSGHSEWVIGYYDKYLHGEGHRISHSRGFGPWQLFEEVTDVDPYKED